MSASGSGTSAPSWGAGRLPAEQERRFVEGVEDCGRFFMGAAEAQRALYRRVAILEAEGLPHAVIGALALNEYGHRRVTASVEAKGGSVE
ncbi:MAG: hypothetical protein HY908_24725 [Myxococcales bacterium]|nr:hypothetical protein [Myxococcales bacterium]